MWYAPVLVVTYCHAHASTSTYFNANRAAFAAETDHESEATTDIRVTTLCIPLAASGARTTLGASCGHAGAALCCTADCHAPLVATVCPMAAEIPAGGGTAVGTTDAVADARSRVAACVAALKATMAAMPARTASNDAPPITHGDTFTLVASIQAQLRHLHDALHSFARAKGATDAAGDASPQASGQASQPSSTPISTDAQEAAAPPTTRAEARLRQRLVSTAKQHTAGKLPRRKQQQRPRRQRKPDPFVTRSFRPPLGLQAYATVNAAVELCVALGVVAPLGVLVPPPAPTGDGEVPDSVFVPIEERALMVRLQVHRGWGRAISGLSLERWPLQDRLSLVHRCVAVLAGLLFAPTFDARFVSMYAGDILSALLVLSYHPDAAATAHGTAVAPPPLPTRQASRGFNAAHCRSILAAFRDEVPVQFSMPPLLHLASSVRQWPSL